MTMNALVLQCGGPTAVVNVSLAAIARRWRLLGGGTLWGGRRGLAALMTGDWVSLSEVDTAWLSAIEALPGMALGGARDRLSDQQLQEGVRRLETRGIEILFLIGGNGTMAAGRAVAAYAPGAGIHLRVLGVPKTIDNDVPRSDVCPGFPSAARFLLHAVRDVAADTSSMRGYEDVVLVETMGRHSGWLAAATLLARTHPGDAPHLVLVPERAVLIEEFLAAVRDQHARAGICVVTVAEGIRGGDGVLFAERGATRNVERDASGQVILGRSGGPLPLLATFVRERLRLRCREVRPDVLQRCSTAHVTPLDRHIAALAAADAVDLALGGDARAPVMLALRHDTIGWRTEPVPLDEIHGERTLPLDLLVDPSPLRELLL
jgi:6-phosphofructokinase